MRVEIIGSAAWSFLRRYFMATLLVAVVAHTVWSVFFTEMPPNPVHPPCGYVSPRNFVQLEWSGGKEPGPVTVQVSVDETEFVGELLVDKKVKGKHFSLSGLERGRAYFWRVLPARGEPGRVMKFETTPDAARYR